MKVDLQKVFYKGRIEQASGCKTLKWRQIQVICEDCNQYMGKH